MEYTSVKFRLSRTDFNLLQNIIVKKLVNSPQLRTKVLFAKVFAWIPFGIGFFSLARLFEKNDWQSELTQMTAAFLLWMIAFFASTVYEQSLYRKNWILPDGWFLREQHIKLSKVGFEILSEDSSFFCSWSLVTEHIKDSTNHYLFIDASQAVVLPLRVLDQSVLAAELLNSGLNQTTENDQKA
jgi:hypothetical protein